MDLEADQLMGMARRDSETAVIALIEAFYERIFGFMRRLAGNDADAADLTQRVFARLPQALQSFAGRSSVSSWIHGIAHHVYVDWRRADHRAEPRSDSWWETLASAEAWPDELAGRADMARTLYASVDALDADLRETVTLHYYEALTLQETADAMGVATSTVKYRLRQALAELQRKLSPLEPHRLGTRSTI